MKTLLKFLKESQCINEWAGSVENAHPYGKNIGEEDFKHNIRFVEMYDTNFKEFVMQIANIAKSKGFKASDYKCFDVSKGKYPAYLVAFNNDKFITVCGSWLLKYSDAEVEGLSVKELFDFFATEEQYYKNF